MTQISINPVLTTNAPGSFAVTSLGFIQGVAMDDPAIRNQLAGGYLDPAETLPMWGGVGITEYVPTYGAASPNPSLGGPVKRATALGGALPLTAFSVFDQAHAMVNSPQSPVPLAGQNMSVNFYRLGSRARIVVAASAALVAAAQGGLYNQNLSWDFALQQLIVYDGANAVAVKILDVSVGNAMVVAYDVVTGFATWTRTGNAALVLI